MESITATEFLKRTEENPSWAKNLTQPLAISQFVGLDGSQITHLSPLLHFNGINEDGVSAILKNCHQLQSAEGTFKGAVGFHDCGIQKIGELQVLNEHNFSYAALFDFCHKLKEASGLFHGAVRFSNCGIEKIGKLIITQPNENGRAANFEECYKLKIAEGTFPGYVDFKDSAIEKIGNLVINGTEKSNDVVANFFQCLSLKIAEGTFAGGVSFAMSGIQEIGDLVVPETAPVNFEYCERIKHVKNPKFWLQRPYTELGKPLLETLKQMVELQKENEDKLRKTPTLEI